MLIYKLKQNIDSFEKENKIVNLISLSKDTLELIINESKNLYGNYNEDIKTLYQINLKIDNSLKLNDFILN